jgi:hypothetical protein
MVVVLLLTIIFGDLLVRNRFLWVVVGAAAALLVMWLFLGLHAVEGGEPQDPAA